MKGGMKATVEWLGALFAIAIAASGIGFVTEGQTRLGIFVASVGVASALSLVGSARLVGAPGGARLRLQASALFGVVGVAVIVALATSGGPWGVARGLGLAAGSASIYAALKFARR